MNADSRLQHLEGLQQELISWIYQSLASGGHLSDELQGSLARELEQTENAIAQLRSQPQATPTQAPQIMQEAAPTPSQQLMWILAGQREDVFLQYIQSYPDPDLQSLSRNPDELERVVTYLHQMMPSERPAVSQEGIPHAEINSSNIYGFSYDPKNKKLFVKFQGGESATGPVYQYEGVPPNVFKAFSSGSVPARTDGQNNYGRWWKGKLPSLGAAFYDLIRMGGYPYARVS